MTGNLVDNEDYPRQDIDLYAVRFARNRIICEYYGDAVVVTLVLLFSDFVSSTGEAIKG